MNIGSPNDSEYIYYRVFKSSTMNIDKEYNDNLRKCQEKTVENMKSM